MRPKRTWILNALVALAAVACLTACSAPEDSTAGDGSFREGTVTLGDGMVVAYDTQGKGKTTLLLVHGWACHKGFWQKTAASMVDEYRIVSLDLPGHGQSGTNRSEWSVTGLSDAIVAVADELKLKRMVLVGHSMGGPVALAAAAKMPDRTIGVVGIDTLHDAEFKYPPEMADAILASFEPDFAAGMRSMFGFMAGSVDDTTRDWLITEASASDADAAIALMKDYPSVDFPSLFRDAGVPIRAINAGNAGGAPPTRIEANRTYADYDAVVFEDVGHFLHMEDPARFAEALGTFLDELEGGA